MLLWLRGLVGWSASYGMWTLTMITQSSWVRLEGGLSSSKLCGTCKTAIAHQTFIPISGKVEGNIAISTVLMLVYVGLLEPCANLALVLGWMQRFQQYMNSGPDHSVIESTTRRGIVILKAMPHQQEIEEQKLCCQWSIGVSFVGLLEPCTTLALWLGWM